MVAAAAANAIQWICIIYWRCSDLLLLLPPPLMLGCCAAVLIDRAMPWQMLVELVLAASPADQGIRHGWH